MKTWRGTKPEAATGLCDGGGLLGEGGSGRVRRDEVQAGGEATHGFLREDVEPGKGGKKERTSWRN